MIFRFICFFLFTILLCGYNSNLIFGKDIAYTFYTIQKGSTANEVASFFKMPLSELEKLNPSIKKHWLSGQKIRLPLSSVKQYKIEKGDSLYSIAQKFGIPVPALQKTIPLRMKKSLWVGATIMLPANSKPSEIEDNTAKTPETPKQKKLYIVKKGDTYYSIARDFGADVNEIQDMNVHRNLLAGSQIFIPLPNPETEISAPKTSTANSFEDSSLSSKSKNPEIIMSPFKGKLLPPYKGPSHSYSDLAKGITYKIDKDYGSLVLSPIPGNVTYIEPFLGFGKGIFIRNGDTTIVLASKGFSTIFIKPGQIVNALNMVARVKYGYTLFLFNIRDGIIRPPF